MVDNGADPANHPGRSTYDASDLKFFHELVDDILAELTSHEDYLFESSPRGELRLQLAAAVFQCADSGEWAYDSLRKSVINQFLMPASLRRAGSR